MSRRKTAKDAARLASAPPVASGPPPDSALALAPDLLGRVAAALNDCERAGLMVEIAHGAVISDAGYVFRIVLPHEPNMGGETWHVRSRMFAEFPVPNGDDLDD